jgi:hypothetical protein
MIPAPSLPVHRFPETVTSETVIYGLYVVFEPVENSFADSKILLIDFRIHNRFSGYDFDTVQIARRGFQLELSAEEMRIEQFRPSSVPIHTIQAAIFPKDHILLFRFCRPVIEFSSVC